MATKPKPTIAERASQAICPNCGETNERKSARAIYCSHECKVEKASRDLNRGKAIITLAQGWRIDRGSGEVAKEAFKEFVSILDQFNSEDAAAGRPRADLAAAKLLATGYRYMDRKQPKGDRP